MEFCLTSIASCGRNTKIRPTLCLTDFFFFADRFFATFIGLRDTKYFIKKERTSSRRTRHRFFSHNLIFRKMINRTTLYHFGCTKVWSWCTFLAFLIQISIVVEELQRLKMQSPFFLLFGHVEKKLLVVIFSKQKS